MHDQLKHNGQANARGSVMVVDDDKHVRSLLARWLSDDGWACQSAESATEALAKLEVCHADVVVTDINMPERSGIWLLEQIKRLFHDTHVLMLTGYGETRSAIDCLTMGAS